MRRLPFLTKSDRRALLFLEWILILGIIALWIRTIHKPASQEAILADSLSSNPASLYSDHMSSTTHKSRSGRLRKESSFYVPESIETFPFDPNTADSTQLLRLGLAPWQVRAIYKYRSMHGRYHTPEDFKRLPGMTMELWTRLSPYIRIGEQFRYLDDSDIAFHRQDHRSSSSSKSHDSSFQAEKVKESNQATLSDTLHREPVKDEISFNDGDTHGKAKSSSPYSVGRMEKVFKYPHGTVVDANLADTTELKKIPQIGSYRAKKIVDYREALGGFVKVEQVMESCEMPDDVFEWFCVSEVPLRRLNVNNLTLRQLMRHPYISFYQARAIVEYRKGYGDIKNQDQLLLLNEFTEEDVNRLSSYLEF